MTVASTRGGHQCAPPRSAMGDMPPYDTLWRCSCKSVWAVTYKSSLDAEGHPGQTIKVWSPASRLRYVKRYGLRA